MGAEDAARPAQLGLGRVRRPVGGLLLRVCPLVCLQVRHRLGNHVLDSSLLGDALAEVILLLRADLEHYRSPTGLLLGHVHDLLVGLLCLIGE